MVECISPLRSSRCWDLNGELYFTTTTHTDQNVQFWKTDEMTTILQHDFDTNTHHVHMSVGSTQSLVTLNHTERRRYAERYVSATTADDTRPQLRNDHNQQRRSAPAWIVRPHDDSFQYKRKTEIW